MKKSGMKASSLKKLLAALLVILILAIGGGFYLGLQQIKTYAVEVSHTVADSEASGDTVGQLQSLKQVLADSGTLVTKANQLFSTEANYQSQALTDVQKYASSAGLTISSTNFNASSDPATGALPVTAGKNFTIALQSPVSYTKLLQFLDNIEGNLPKMQITSISLGRTASGTADQVTVGDVKIVISTR